MFHVLKAWAFLIPLTGPAYGALNIYGVAELIPRKSGQNDKIEVYIASE